MLLALGSWLLAFFIAFFGRFVSAIGVMSKLFWRIQGEIEGIAGLLQQAVLAIEA